MGRHSLLREPATRRVALGATALAASATLTAGLAFGDGQAQASIPQVTSGLASIHDWSTATLDEAIAALGIESQGIAGGVALGPNYLIQQLTDLLNVPGLDAEEIEEILSLVGINFGNELAIALLPGVAAAIPLGAGSSAAALSILGVALATDGVTNISNSIWDYELLGLIPVAPILEAFGIDRADLPDDTVFCLGALAAANSKTAGSCLNIAATFDARYIKVADGQQSGEVQLALTNPLSVLTLLTDQDQLLDILAQAITGSHLRHQGRPPPQSERPGEPRAHQRLRILGADQDLVARFAVRAVPRHRADTRHQRPRLRQLPEPAHPDARRPDVASADHPDLRRLVVQLLRSVHHPGVQHRQPDLCVADERDGPGVGVAVGAARADERVGRRLSDHRRVHREYRDKRCRGWWTDRRDAHLDHPGGRSRGRRNHSCNRLDGYGSDCTAPRHAGTRAGRDDPVRAGRRR